MQMKRPFWPPRLSFVESRLFTGCSGQTWESRLFVSRDPPHGGTVHLGKWARERHPSTMMNLRNIFFPHCT